MSKQNRARKTALYWQAISFFLAGLVLASPAVNFAKSGGGPAVAALSVNTDPVDAAVYVDGKFAGHTPLRVDEMAVGDHRVRVVKDGYLENSRVVSVSQRTNVVQVKLTPSATTGTAAVTAAAPTGNSKKWLWVAIAGGGAAAGTIVYLATKNEAPSVSTVTPSASIGLAAGAGIIFTANASDKDGDALKYSWDYGDGATETTDTASATHVFNSAGNLTVKVSVSDSKHQNASSTTTGVTIKNLTGTWKGVLSGPTTNFNTIVTLAQSGSSLTGAYADQFPGTGSVSGSVKSTSPIVTFTVSIPGFQAYTFTGNPSTDINTLSGQANNGGFSSSPWTLTRQ